MFITKNCNDLNCFIKKTDETISTTNNDATITTIDQITQNSLSVMIGKLKDDSNRLLYNAKHLIIDNFQNCNGKEVTQEIITELLLYRIQNGLTTHLFSDYDYSELQYISNKLDDLIRNNFVIDLVK